MTKRSQFDFCDGVTRRGMIQAGLLGTIGLSCADLLRFQAQAASVGNKSRGKSVIYLELAGGPSQHETYDPKPEAPFRRSATGSAPVVDGIRTSARTA